MLILKLSPTLSNSQHAEQIILPSEKFAHHSLNFFFISNANDCYQVGTLLRPIGYKALEHLRCFLLVRKTTAQIPLRATKTVASTNNTAQSTYVYARRTLNRRRDGIRSGFSV